MDTTIAPRRTWAHHTGRFLLVCCCVLGTFCVLAGALSTWERYQTESWIARDAVITKSELSWSLRSNRESWFPKISVEFLDTQEEVRVAVAYGRWLGWNDQIRRTAEADVARYPVGRTVPVYHAPDDPQTAVLERHPWPERAVLIALGLVMILISVRILRSRSKASTPAFL